MITASCLNWISDRFEPSVAGPKRPQDRIDLSKLKEQFTELMLKPASEGGYGKTEDELWTRYHVKIGADRQRHGRRWRRTTNGNDSGRLSATTSSDKNTSVWTETEMVNNRPTPDLVADIPEDEFHIGDELDRTRRRSDRRDHVLHKHFESERDARGRLACEESRRSVDSPSVRK